MKMESLRNYAEKLFNVRLNGHQLHQFEIYERELQDWNKVINLTAISGSEEIQSKHFLDSISTSLVFKERQIKRVVDVGSGAGFPGLVIKIFLPEIDLVLVESVGKKVHFCEHITKKLKLTGIKVVKARAEDIGRDSEHREKYDCAIARAVASLPILSEYLLPLVSINGIVVAQKGETGPAEAQKAEYAMHVLGGKLQKIIHVTLPSVVEERYLVVIDKVATTPAMYPRRVGIPSKRPLIGKK